MWYIIILSKYFLDLFFTYKLQVLLRILLQNYTCVQLCWHDAIDEWYGLLKQFVMFGEFFDKKIVIY